MERVALVVIGDEDADRLSTAIERVREIIVPYSDCPDSMGGLQIIHDERRRIGRRRLPVRSSRGPVAVIDSNVAGAQSPTRDPILVGLAGYARDARVRNLRGRRIR